MNFKRVSISLLVMLVCAAIMPAFAQASIAPPPPADPQYIVALGAGFSQYTDPHYAVTGSFGIRTGDGTYEITSLDTATKYDAATKRFLPFSTIRTGVERIIVRQGPATLGVHGDAGLAVGAGSVVGAFSGGGTLTYSLPKNPKVFLYGTVRILKSPQDDPALSNPAIVQTAFSFGVGWKF